MELTLHEAWADFVFSLHQSGKWETLSRSERQYFDKANRQVKGGAMPLLKLKRLFDKYAPGVYEMGEVLFKKTKCQDADKIEHLDIL